jgi:hypothetical protein
MPSYAVIWRLVEDVVYGTLHLMFQAGVAAGDDIDEELLEELVGSTGAWKSWSSQFLGGERTRYQHQVLATIGLRLTRVYRSCQILPSPQAASSRPWS